MWSDPYLINLFSNKTPLIDVRSPVEFAEGSIPHSINLPILNDEERTLVGTCYKQQGQEAAIKLGHELVSGVVKTQRINAWKTFLENNPETEVFCFRGGLRSQISCQWLRENGVEKYPIEGGHKRLRRFFLSYLLEAPLLPLYRLSGFTGSGKTQVLQHLKNTIDLEKLASHRGSAFGENGLQPSQVRFENELALKIMKSKQFVVVEDESAVIGKLSIPRRFFSHMRSSPMIILKSSEESRVQNIFDEYVLPSDQTTMLKALNRIEKGLGGVRFKEVRDEMLRAFESSKTVQEHGRWISLLMCYYYDPFYQKDLARQKELVIFEGSESEIRDFINSRPEISTHP